MTKNIKEGISFNQKDVLNFLMEFSAFKDRVEKKFKEIALELNGKNNEHELWVTVYLIASDYAEESNNRKIHSEPIPAKIS
ncbi:MAG: hypothetical protein MJ157_01105 [Clostridia bacterium]|nr:hypothetical protein [Clostridia bacterium]